MPGLICSAYRDPHGTDGRWDDRIDLLNPNQRLTVDHYSEPGFHLACAYHPGVCRGPRLLVTDDLVLAVYGNLYDTELAAADGGALCRALLDRFLRGGAERLQHLNGRYDIAVWERRNRTLSMISDRFGANRHYYLHRPGALHIACEVKGVATELDRLEVDPAGLATMLIFGYHLGDLTILSGVHCLPNAYRLAYRPNADRLLIDRYWDYPYGEMEASSQSEAELADALHERLTVALTRRLRGVDKVLLPLSGGLDSRTLAALLRQSGFSGDVLAYSYGERGSRDVRYGRAVAKRLGYPHVAIPKPPDFMTRHLQEDAWCFDAEWSGELHWAFRFAHKDPALGDTQSSHVLSGMHGDIILGSNAFKHLERGGEKPLDASQLSALYTQIHQEYASPGDTLGLFSQAAAAKARGRIDAMLQSMFSRLANLKPFYALSRAAFEQRQHRHTSMVAQSIERDKPVLTPFLDNDVVELAMRIPYESLIDRRLYRRMIRTHCHEVASVPYSANDLPLSDAPIRAAIKWRKEQVLRSLPWLQNRLRKRNAFFRFAEGIYREATFFTSRMDVLRELAPPLDSDKAVERYHALVTGRLAPAGQACAFLPSALYMSELRKRFGAGNRAT